MRSLSPVKVFLSCFVVVCSACSGGSKDDPSTAITKIGHLGSGEAPENTSAETALSVGEWAYTAADADNAKEYLWFCSGGQAAYRRDGDFAGQPSRAVFPGQATGLVGHGHFKVYGEEYVKVLEVQLDSGSDQRFDLVMDSDTAFSLPSKRFIRTGRGCEFAYN